MEHLFMQIFDRKAWIEGQLRHHIQSYGESMAYNLLADGKHPPPWLWSDGSGNCVFPNHQEPNGELFASGILNPLPWGTTLSAKNTPCFTLPTFKADKVTQLNKLPETCASNKHPCSENSDKAVPNASELCPYRKAEPKAIEACAESKSLAILANLECRHSKVENLLRGEENTATHLGQERSSMEEHTGQLGPSKMSSVEADSVKELSAISDPLHFHNTDGCRVTRSRSRTLSNHNNNLDKLFGHPEALTCVKNDEYEAVERKTDFMPIPSLYIENIACNNCHNLTVSRECSSGTAASSPHSRLEMSNAVDSMLPDSFALFEPKKLLFDCTEECDVSKNYSNPSEKENHGSACMSLSKSDTVRSTKEILPCRDLEELNGLDGSASQYWQPNRDKVLNVVSENRQEFVELHDSEHRSHSLSGHQSVHLNVYTRNSLDCLVNHAIADQCNIQLNGMLKCDVAFTPFEDNALVEPKNFERHSSKESGLSIGSMTDLESETKPSSSAKASMEMESQQPSRVSLSSDSDGAHVPLINRQLHKFDDLPTVDVMTSEEADGISGQASKSGKLSEVLQLESASCPLYKLLHGPAKSSLKLLCEISKSAPSCSSSVTDLMLKSDEGTFSNRRARLETHNEQSVRDPVKHKIEGQHTEMLIKETNTSLQFMKATRNDVFSEAGEIGASSTEAVRRNVLESILTPVDDESDHKMLEVQHASSHSINNGKISFSCKLVGPAVHSSSEVANCLPDQENVVNGSIMNVDLSPTGKRSYSSVTHSTQPTVRYFLRSSTSREKSLSSLQGTSSVSYTKKNSTVLETEVNEMCADPENVPEKSLKYHKITPDITKTINELPKARYLLRSLASHDNLASSWSSYVDGGMQSMKTIPDTWPKRRKIENLSSNVLGTSPRLRIKHFLHNQEGSNSKYKIKGTTEVGYEPILSSPDADYGIWDTSLASSSELLHQSKKCWTMEGRPCIREDVAPFPVEHAQEEPFSDLASELINCKPQKLYTKDDGHDSVLAQNIQESEIQRSSFSSGRFFQDKEISDVDISLQMHNTAQFEDCDVDSVGFDETMPEFEGFSMDIPSITEKECSYFPSLQKERISVFKELGKPRNILTPVSNLSSKYNIHEIPDVCRSLPSGLMEHMDLSCALQFCDADMEYFRVINDGFYGNLGADNNGNFSGRTYSRSLPYSTTKNDHEGRKPPLTPHVMKFNQRVVSGFTADSSEKVGSNPELICFRIDENSTIANENEHIDRLDASEENLVLKGNKNSANRKALFDVTEKYQNVPTVVSDPKKFQHRCSLESVNSQSHFETQISSHMSLGNDYASNKKFEIADKESGDHSVNNNRVRKAAVSLHNRASKPCVPRKTNRSGRSQSNSGKECKPSNIISNISSFIPFVRLKQQTTASLKGKKEIKVKALEAAEAAKRIEEKKQNEREMRKIAARLERERLEQENIRLLELKQKQKEEEKKKKEAEIAARKRQREEGEREKKRKRRCIEETRRQHKEHEEKSRAIKGEKELQRKASDDKEQMQKEMNIEAKQKLKSQKGGGVAGCQNGTDVHWEATKLIAVATSSGSNTLEAVDYSNKPNDIETAASNSDGLQGGSKEKITISEVDQDMQSYEMSPYRDSDDEDDQEEIRRKHKHVPLWARRECLEQIILSKQFLDPTKVFCRKHSFHLAEALSTRITR